MATTDSNMKTRYRILFSGCALVVLGAGLGTNVAMAATEASPNQTTPASAVGNAPAAGPVAIAAAALPAMDADWLFPAVIKGADGYWRISFQNLASFAFHHPHQDAPVKPGSAEGVPARVQELDGKVVCVGGYMLPLKLEKGLVTQFLLIRSPMVCCYGVTPEPNEWIVVKMKGPGVAVMSDVPLNLYGTLHVGRIYEDQMFSGIYELDGEKVTAN